jgi:tetratricopeptide (TPR) repeat protein
MLKRVIELDGTNFSAAYNLGAAYLKKQMVPEALAAFQQAAAINPDYAAAHRALGELMLYQGQVDESIAELRRAAALEPRNAGTHAALAKALTAKGLTAEADEEMRKAQHANDGTDQN